MCGRFTLAVDGQALIDRYNLLDIPFPFVARFNAAPRQHIPAILRTNDHNRVGLLQWGLIPSFSEDDKLASKMINARSETITIKRSFRQLLIRKRVIIPADGFVEWRTDEGKRKTPLRFVMKYGRIFSLAGLYDTWVNEKGEKVSTCTIITTTPNEIVKPVHDRMPVILHPDKEFDWLDRNITDQSYLTSLLAPYDANEMKAYQISNMIGNVKNDHAECIAPLL